MFQCEEKNIIKNALLSPLKIREKYQFNLVEFSFAELIYDVLIKAWNIQKLISASFPRQNMLPILKISYNNTYSHVCLSRIRIEDSYVNAHEHFMEKCNIHFSSFQHELKCQHEMN